MQPAPDRTALSEDSELRSHGTAMSAADSKSDAHFSERAGFEHATSVVSSFRPSTAHTIPSTVVEMRQEVEVLRRDRDRLAALARTLERKNDQYRESFLRNERSVRDAMTEVAALRTSTSWAITRPLRFLSKSWSALRKGPAYWRHVYAVREQVRANWLRENPVVAAPEAIGTSSDGPTRAPEVDTENAPSQDEIGFEARLDGPSSGNARVRDALMRAGNFDGVLR